MANRLDHSLMTSALGWAGKALEQGELPVGAVVADPTGKVMGSGWKTPTVHWRLDHAEIIALRHAIPLRPERERGVNDDRLKGLTLYTTLEPCVMCIGAIMNCRIPRVVYALEDPYGGGCGLLRTGRPPRHEQEYPDIVGGVLVEESKALFRQFFRTTGSEFWRNAENPLVRLCLGP